jgi:hypothetical protein
VVLLVELRHWARPLGVGSSQVVAQALCTVTVVKTPDRESVPVGTSPR